MSQRLKKSRSRDSGDQAQLGQRRCGNCGKTGYNARTCQKDTEISSESDENSSYVGSMIDLE